MPKVEFVKLKKEEKALHLCRLAEEFFAEGERVLILVHDDNQAVTLDRFMWTWKKGSFLPHAFANGAVDCLDEPVVIAVEERNPNGARVLIMGRPASLEFTGQFERIIDFAEMYDDALAEAARRRFARFREAGFAPSMR
ncbi:DNA polymerase III subunit chi [Trichloromonas sp.]|uniref:DNA polymerase III subunit chi n=1 Tax=Trichloromonas sp. TaxID=3069249 RepID=UPI002A3DB1CF|nr:DNA polymerase III subunit chi [Trichloromonas sp.]